MKNKLSAFALLALSQFVFSQSVTLESGCSTYEDANGTYSPTEENGKKYIKEVCLTRTERTACIKGYYEIEWIDDKWAWNTSNLCRWSSLDDTCRTSSSDTVQRITIATSSSDTPTPSGLTDWVGDCTPIITSSTLGVSEEGLKNNMSYYPNPSNGIFNLEFANPYESVEITLVNEVGQMVMTQSYKNKGSIQLDVKKQKDGVYFVKIDAGDKKEAVIKLIKKQK